MWSNWTRWLWSWAGNVGIHIGIKRIAREVSVEPWIMDQSDQLRKSRQKCHQEAAARRQTSWCVASNVLPQQEIMIQVSIWLFLTNTGLGDTSTATQLWGKSQTSMKSICILGEIYIPEKWSGKKTLTAVARSFTADCPTLLVDARRSTSPPGKKETPQGLVEKKSLWWMKVSRNIISEISSLWCWHWS